MTSPIVIREARPEDDPRIGELLVEAFVGTYAQKMPEVVVTEHRIQDLKDVARKRETACVLVAELEGQVIGTLTLYPADASATQVWHPKSTELRFMAVDPKLHGKGVAARLLAEARETAVRWGASSICLHVRRGAHGVARMYLRHGYVREPQGDIDKLPEIFLEAYRLPLT